MSMSPAAEPTSFGNDNPLCTHEDVMPATRSVLSVLWMGAFVSGKVVVLHWVSSRTEQVALRFRWRSSYLSVLYERSLVVRPQ